MASLKDLVNNVEGFFKGAGNAVQHAVQPAEQQAQNFVHNIPQQAINFGNLAGSFAHHVGQVAGNQPMMGFNPVGLNTPNIKIAGPTFGQYAQGQYGNQAKTIANPKAPLPDRLQAGVQLGVNTLAPLSSTLYNTVGGAAAGALKTARQGGDLKKNIAESMAHPSDIGGTGLGIKNPIIAAGVDLATGNPKSLLKGAKGIAQSLYRSPHADDAKILDQASEILQSAKPNLKDVVRARKDISNLLHGYIKERMPKAQYDDLLKSPTTKQIGVLQDFFKSADKPYPTISSGQVQMGLVNKNKTIGQLQQEHQSPDLTAYEKAFNNGDVKTLDSLSAAHPGDTRFSVHLNNRTDMSTPPQMGQQVGDGRNNLQQDTLQNTTELPTQEINNPSLSPAAAQTQGRSAEALIQQSGLPPENSSGKSIAQVPNSENPYFNTNKLNVSPEAKQQVNRVIQEVKPQIQNAVGKKLTNKEVIDAANNSAKILHKVVDRSETEDFSARLLKTRQQLAAAAESGKVDQEYIDNLMAVKSHATDIARKLQSFSIGADPKTITSRDAILDAVLKVEKDSSKVVEAAKGVDFNDLKQATDFYRTFIKPSWKEKIDLVRYNSMLSSPNTHIVNATSNLMNSGFVAPLEKTLTGTLDFLGSKVSGKPQTQFAGEGIEYAKGYVNSLHDAAHTFANSLRGKTITSNLDVRQIPLSTDGRINNLALPTRLLEASDQFFTKLTQGAETAALQYRKSKGVNVGNIETKTLDNAKYRLFRSELFDKRQGGLLNFVDHFTSLIQKARNIEAPKDATSGEKMGAIIANRVANFTLPFVQTPMNILKQGIEYSPAGLLTIPGATNKTEQLSKAIIGSSAAAATALLVTSGRTTWAEPTDPTKKAAFRAAGMQPYAVKIGDNWVSYAKLPPSLGFPIALFSAYNDALQNKTIDQNQFNVLMNATAKWGNFFTDQSYLKNIGDLVTAAKGSPESMSRFISNYPQQLLPYRALFGWMARLVDPYQRKVNTDAPFLEQQVQQLFTQIPGLSMTVPARVTKDGEPIPNQNQAVNAFSPFKITSERPDQKQTYDLLQQKSLLNKNINAAEKMMQNGQTPDFSALQASAAENKPNTKDQLQLKAQEDIAKKKVELQGGTQTIGDKIFYNDNGSVKTVDLAPPTKGQGIDAFTNENWNVTKAVNVMGTNLPQEQKNQVLQKLGVDPQDAEYAYKASHNTDVSTQYIVSKSPDHDTLVNNLTTGRVVGINGQQFASNAVVDAVYNKGLITKDEATALKKMKIDKSGKSLVATGGGKGRTKSKKVITIKSAPATTIKSAPLKLSRNVKIGGHPATLKSPPTIKIGKSRGLANYRVSKITAKFSTRPSLTA